MYAPDQGGAQDRHDPPGPPARTVALAFFGAVEGTVIQVAGLAPYDEALAARAAAGVLGLGPDPISIQ